MDFALCSGEHCPLANKCKRTDWFEPPQIAWWLKPIDNASKTHKTVDENGNPYTLNDHFGEMVDEMETYMLGMRNQIHKIVTKKVTIDGKDIQQFKKDCLQNGN